MAPKPPENYDEFNYVKIGYVAKAHGVDGTVVVRFSEDELYETDLEEPLFIDIQGTKVPFFIESYRDAGDHALVKLEFVNSPVEVRRIRNCSVYAGIPVSEIPDGKENFSGWEFEDLTSGKKGILLAYAGNEMNPLLILDIGGDEFLVPANPGFVEKTEAKKKRVCFRFPEGIFDQD